VAIGIGINIHFLRRATSSLLEICGRKIVWILLGAGRAIMFLSQLFQAHKRIRKATYNYRPVSDSKHMVKEGGLLVEGSVSRTVHGSVGRHQI
jgi:hypothetical protein